MAARKKNEAQLLREKTASVALRALERLDALLNDPDTSNAEVIKAAALVFDRIDSSHAEGGTPGDYEICIKED